MISSLYTVFLSYLQNKSLLIGSRIFMVFVIDFREIGLYDLDV